MVKSCSSPFFSSNNMITRIVERNNIIFYFLNIFKYCFIDFSCLFIVTTYIFELFTLPISSKLYELTYPSPTSANILVEASFHFIKSYIVPSGVAVYSIILISFSYNLDLFNNPALRTIRK